jgi:peptide/nickel transport system substrate-binding protein
VGEREVVWVGKPGFTTADLEQLFWAPLPAHLFAEGADWQMVADDSAWTGTLPGFGPFQIVEWGAETVRLERNSSSFEYIGDEGTIDEITFRVIAEPADAVAALRSGECDVLDSSYHLESRAELLSGLQSDTTYQVLAGQSDSWMQLVFGIQPASYDDYYNPVYGDRPDIFGDVRVRQAIAACLDRDALQAAVYNGLAEIWPSFVSPEKSQLDETGGILYDPAEAVRLLEEAGWQDHDGDAATPRQAWTIGNVPQGTSLQLNLYLDQSALSEALAAVIEDSLAQCGIGVTPVSLAPSELYAPGPEGVLFGRQFDLVLLAWAPMDEPDCALYESWQVPNDENQWIGTNIAGLVESLYDAACNDATLALPGGAAGALGRAEAIYLDTLPAIPLFSVPQVIVASADLCAREAVLSEVNFFSQLADASLGGVCSE